MSAALAAETVGQAAEAAGKVASHAFYAEPTFIVMVAFFITFPVLEASRFGFSMTFGLTVAI